MAALQPQSIPQVVGAKPRQPDILAPKQQPKGQPILPQGPAPIRPASSVSTQTAQNQSILLSKQGRGRTKTHAVRPAGPNFKQEPGQQQPKMTQQQQQQGQQGTVHHLVTPAGNKMVVMSTGAPLNIGTAPMVSMGTQQVVQINADNVQKQQQAAQQQQIHLQQQQQQIKNAQQQQQQQQFLQQQMLQTQYQIAHLQMQQQPQQQLQVTQQTAQPQYIATQQQQQQAQNQLLQHQAQQQQQHQQQQTMIPQIMIHQGQGGIQGATTTISLQQHQQQQQQHAIQPKSTLLIQQQPHASIQPTHVIDQRQVSGMTVGGAVTTTTTTAGQQTTPQLVLPSGNILPQIQVRENTPTQNILKKPIKSNKMIPTNNVDLLFQQLGTASAPMVAVGNVTVATPQNIVNPLTSPHQQSLQPPANPLMSMATFTAMSGGGGVAVSPVPTHLSTPPKDDDNKNTTTPELISTSGLLSNQNSMANFSTTTTTSTQSPTKDVTNKSIESSGSLAEPAEKEKNTNTVTPMDTTPAKGKIFLNKISFGSYSAFDNLLQRISF